MKFSATFKCPDALDEAVRDLSNSRPSGGGSTAADEGELAEMLREELLIFAAKWIQYGKYVTIDFDTEADTAIVRRKK